MWYWASQLILYCLSVCIHNKQTVVGHSCLVSCMYRTGYLWGGIGWYDKYIIFEGLWRIITWVLSWWWHCDTYSLVFSHCMRSVLRTVVVLTTCRRLPGNFLISSPPSYCSAGPTGIVAMVHTKCRQEFYQHRTDSSNNGQVRLTLNTWYIPPFSLHWKC